MGSLSILGDDCGVENFGRAVAVSYVRPNGAATGGLGLRHAFLRVGLVRVDGFVFPPNEELGQYDLFDGDDVVGV